MTLLADIVSVSRHVSETSSRLAKIREIAACLKRVEHDEIPIAIAYLSGETPQGKLGVAYATLQSARVDPPPSQPALMLREVDAHLSALAAVSGKGSAAVREERIAALFGRATAEERDFLTRLIVGELRQGALKGVMAEALAAAAEVPATAVRRAAMSAGSLAEVARVALTEGAMGLTRFAIRLMQPVLPMLSQPTPDTDAALERLGVAAFEWKLDGARVQVHKAGSDVRVYTRNLNEVSLRVPELVEAVREARAQSLILDGEAIALRPDRRPYPFQVTMSRFGSGADVAARDAVPLSISLFDCLHVDGEDLLDRPSTERFTLLASRVPESLRVARIELDQNVALINVSSGGNRSRDDFSGNLRRHVRLFVGREISGRGDVARHRAALALRR